MVERKEKLTALKTDVQRRLPFEVFKESFSGFDILWFTLAAYTALKIGSGFKKEEV